MTSCSSLHTKTLLAVALFALGMTTANAGSGQKSASSAAANVPSVIVRYSDLNLASAQGNRVLLRRIVAAATKVCPVPGGNVHSPKTRRCIEEAIARAVSETKIPQLAELLAARRGLIARS